jgi:hypothetical protein
MSLEREFGVDPFRRGLFKLRRINDAVKRLPERGALESLGLLGSITDPEPPLSQAVGVLETAKHLRSRKSWRPSS